MSSARKYNSYNQSRSSGKRVGFDIRNILFPLVIVCLVGYGLFAFFSFRSIKTDNPLSNSSSDTYLLSQRKDSLKKTLIVFETESEGEEKIEHVYVYVENSDKEESILVHVPNWIYYGGLEGDFGSAVPVSSFKYAGEFLQQGRGVEYAVWQIEQLLAIKFDSYIWFTPDAINVVEDNLGDITGEMVYANYYSNGESVKAESLYINSFFSHIGWFKLVTSAQKFGESSAVIYSDIGSLMGVFLELKDIENSVYSLSPYLLDLGDSSNINTKQADNLGGMVSYLNSSGFDSTWRKLNNKLLDKELEQERIRVEVYNGSGISGAAGQFARKIENSGCDVVRYDNAPDNISESVFYVPNPDEYVNSLEVISELFPGAFDLFKGRPTFMTTGDIVIILGEDISRMYSF